MAHRIDTSTAQKDKFGVGKNGFTRGNPQTGVPATELDDDYFDMLQEEIVGIVEAAGETLDKTKRNQLNTALGKLFQNKTGATSALGALVPAANRLPYFTGANGASLTDLTSVGRDILASATKTAVLEYLGLGDFPEFGDAASKNVGTTVGTVAAGDDSRIVNAVQGSNPGLATAWVDFNGVSPATIKSAHNVSSVTRVSTGRYKINFTTPMLNTNYCAVSSMADGSSAGSASIVLLQDGTNIATANVLKTLNNFDVYIRSTGGAYDSTDVNAIVYGGK